MSSLAGSMKPKCISSSRGDHSGVGAGADFAQHHQPHHDFLLAAAKQGDQAEISGARTEQRVELRNVGRFDATGEELGEVELPGSAPAIYTPCFRLASMKPSRSPSSTAWVLPISYVGAQILDARLVEHVGTDLVAPADVGLGVFQLLLLGLALAQLGS